MKPGIIRGSLLDNYICICQFVVWQPCVCTNRICRLAILHLYQSHLSFGNPAFVLIAFVVWQPCICTNCVAPLDPKPDPCIVLQRVWRRRSSSTSISRLEIELRPKLVQSIIWENFPPNKTVYKEKINLTN